MFVYQENLEDVVLGLLRLGSYDEIDIISGYVGIYPVQQLRDALASTDMKAVVIYGMYGVNGISLPLHESLKKNSGDGVNILYANTPIHSKCYVFKRKGNVEYALEGSGNFTASGMFTPFKESLAEVMNNDLPSVDAYLTSILANSIPCDSPLVVPNKISALHTSPSSRGGSLVNRSAGVDLLTCRMLLIDPYTKDVPAKSGLNWGFQDGHGSVSRNDAYIAIRAEYIDEYPTMFPKKQNRPFHYSAESEGRAGRENDTIEIIWDDGYVMRGLLEGSFPHRGTKYPKQISSFPSKAELGSYIRQRLGVASGTMISRNDLENYGRETINVSLIGDGIYYFDFSRR